MRKLSQVFILALCFLLGRAGFSFAYYDNSIYFEDANQNDVSAYNVGDSVYLDFWDAMSNSYGGSCYCNAATSWTFAVTVTGGSMTTQDSENVTLDSRYSGTNPPPSGGGVFKWRNSTGLPIALATSVAATANNGTLEVENGQTLNVTGQCISHYYDYADTATATASVSITASTGVIVLSNSTSFSASVSSFTPDTDKAYVQVTDSDQNKKGYSAETVTVTLTTTAGDSETVTLTETGNNTGIFKYLTGMSVVSSALSIGNGTLEVSSGGSTITANYNSGEDTETSTTPALTSAFTVLAASPQTAGTPFAVTITAKDASGNTITSYSGTVNLTRNYVLPASGSYNISPTSTSTFTSGVATVNVTYADAGTITITATDSSSSSITGTSSQILLLPANFLVESTGGLNQEVNKPFNLKVTARNSSNSTTPNYNREVNLTTSNVTPTGTVPTISPSSISGSSFSSGAKTVSMTYNKWGTAKITATDTGYSTVTGTTSSAINFYPNSFSVSVAAPLDSRTKFYLEELFDITVKALDYADSVITNYGGTVSFTSVSNVETPDDYTFSSSADSGEKAFSISGDKEKTFQISAKDKNYDTAIGTSSDISLMYGKIKVNDASGRIGTINTTVDIVDKNGDVITSDDSTTFVLTKSESVDNNTASIVYEGLTVKGGTATIGVTDTELESVTITPDAVPTLEAESGVVTFSETAVGGGGARRLGSGARILFWRILRSDEEPR